MLTLILLGLLLFLGLAVATLWLYGRRGDAGVVRASVTIDRPPHELWSWLTEAERLIAWVGWLEEVRELEPGDADGLGMRQVFVMNDPHLKERVELESVIRTLRLHERVDLDLSARLGFEGSVRYALTEVGDRSTRLDYEGRFRFLRWFARLMEPFVTPQAQRKLDEDLVRLKALAEGR